MIGLCDYNWVGGRYHHGIPVWFGEHNVNAEGQRFWKSGKMPDFQLSKDSQARAKGINLSMPFTLGGKTYDPLPGMKPGYFSDTAPDPGAFQYGEKGIPFESVTAGQSLLPSIKVK